MARKMTLSDTLRQEILAGLIAPGTVLSQTELAARFGVSRIPIRDALQQLASERLVIVRPGKGAQVIELTNDELLEIYDLRLLLECDLLRHAIQRATAEDDAEVEYALQKSILEAGRPGWVAGDWLFHATLYAPAGRKKQLSVVEELRRSCSLHAYKYAALSDRTAYWLDDHNKIFQAFVDRRIEEATLCLEKHIETARSFLLDLRGAPSPRKRTMPSAERT